MKVGIITMHRVPNYGSFMQALSLKRMIELLGHEVFFIDYKVEPDIEHRKSIKSQMKCAKKMLIKRIKGTNIGNKVYLTIKAHSNSKDIVAKQRIFSSCNTMLGVTERYHFRTKVDVLVIGSDEVFNCTQLGYNIGYSLELFGKNNRANRVITYAASFGSTTFEKLDFYGMADDIGKLLSKMDAISVRDENSYSIVKRVSDKESERHLDPVLVGDLEYLFVQVPLYDNFIVLYGYTYRFTKDECNKIVRYAHSLNKKVIAIGEPQYECDDYICCKPDEVLGYFKKADYVITDTFHGTIFSVITHTKFLIVIRPSQVGVSGNEEKIESLLKDLGLEKRRLYDFDYLEKISDNIDYNIVDIIRDEARERTLEYLRTNIV